MRAKVTAFVGAIGLASVAAAMATAAESSRVEARGDFLFKPNAEIRGTLQWHGDDVTVASGQRLQIVSADEIPGEPHVFTIVRAREKPRTLDQLFSGNTCPTCQEALAAHDPGDDGEPPFVRVVNKGRPGIDAVGDSFILFDEQTISPRVTARAGATLHFICSIHTEMQGVLHVR